MPSMGSVPMVPNSRPRAPIMKAFSLDPEPRKLTRINPQRMRDTYSGEANFRAKLAKGGARKSRPKRLIVPAMKEAMAAMPRAGPALPLRAIWYPSRQVTTLAASPGMLMRMEVVDPPYMAP